jgi:predicted dehydrogenase
MDRIMRMTRRGLLKRAAGTAAAAVAAPYVLTSSALGGPGITPASERITMGFIGIGNMGGGHLGDVANQGHVQILAISDVKAHVAREGKRQVEEAYAKSRGIGSYKGIDLYNDFRDLLARPDIDCVLIAVPDPWHATCAILAARAGKDIYCEKPLSLTIREAEQMVEAVRRYGRVFQTGSQQRSESNFRFACELVRNGYIGELKKVNVGIGEPSVDKYLPEEPIPEGVDWDRWLGPSPWHPYNPERISGDYGGGWRHIRDTSGGMTTDWGAHHYDIAQWGMGMDGFGKGPVEILPPNGKDILHITFKYPNGVIMEKDNANGILFQGTEGKVEVNRGYLKTWPESLMRVQLKPNDVHLYESPGHKEDWYRCMRTRQRPICDVEIGASTITTCHLSNIAFWLNRPIRWDPVKRQILGDEEASRWLDRPKREPYNWI